MKKVLLAAAIITAFILTGCSNYYEVGGVAITPPALYGE